VQGVVSYIPSKFTQLEPDIATPRYSLAKRLLVACPVYLVAQLRDASLTARR